MSVYIEANIGYCMAPLIENGVDSVKARSICKCTLEQLFIIEPKIREMTSEEWNNIFNKKKEKIQEKCPALKEFTKNAKN